VNALDIYKELGKRIHEIRIKSNITQEKLAELSGVSSNFISQIERGRNKCSLETIDSLSNAMNTPLNELFNFRLPNPSFKDNFTKRIEIMLKNLSDKDKNLVLEITEDVYGKIKRNKRK
jgi:transcriptional regulator with XRE-family HTH domain